MKRIAIALILIILTGCAAQKYSDPRRPKEANKRYKEKRQEINYQFGYR